MGTNFSYFATCPKGVEDILATELTAMGAESVRLGVAGASFTGELGVGYKACLWSRTANRILCILDTSAALLDDADAQLYDFVMQIPWESHFGAQNTFLVDFTGTNKGINNTQYGAVRVKDAIADRFSQHAGERPSVDRQAPDIRVNARLHKNRLTIAVDLSGDSLHKRGYRQDTGTAPLKENLAAALLLRAGWPGIYAQGGGLIDPMCGSGTFLIEAAWMALDKAPGLNRSFGFEAWLQHEPSLWRDIQHEARARDKSPSKPELKLFGYDCDARVLRAAKVNLQNAGCSDYIQLDECSVSELKAPEVPRPGLIICNPPYGERMGQMDELGETYMALAKTAKLQFADWCLAVFTGNADLAQQMRLRAKKRNKFFNGAIASELLVYELLPNHKAKLRTDLSAQEELSPGAIMVANRLRKNRKRLSSWFKRAPTNCYRVYDADMPEYSAAIDIYDNQIHIQEYAPPKTVDATAAQKRLRDLINATSVVFETPKNRIILKTRKRNRGAEQYQNSAEKHQEYFAVEEGQAKLLVNLHDYLDTGLFLDHRPLRLKIAAHVRNKEFLNLFCYTASATVHAALAGAKNSVSVDMSNTYIRWAQQNFTLNHISASRHQLVQQDCLSWLKSCRKGFDIIMLDPPTFSNSKRMDNVLDVQRDHGDLIKRCMELLNGGGTLYFSTNLQSFKLDVQATEAYSVEDITAQTIDEDFSRRKKIHQCFQITHKL